MITLILNLDSVERAAIGFVISCLIVIIFCNRFIKILKSWNKNGQPIRLDGPDTHLAEIKITSKAGEQVFTKKGSPSMGGLLILFSVIVTALLLVKWNPLIVGIMFVTIAYGAIGFFDDFLKISKNNSYRGLSIKFRLIIQVFISIIAVLIMFKAYPEPIRWSFMFIFYKTMLINMDYWFWIFPLFSVLLIFCAFVIISAANAVNITDGLDGLASRISTIVLFGITILAFFMSGTIGRIPYIPETKEVAVLAAIFTGALFGFLWHNSFPAKIFMGDCGSLAIGGAMGAMVVALKHELFLAVAGIIFVIEALSSLIQILYYKKTGKRFFLMAPIHHHFEKKGFSEVMITERFSVITFLAVVIALTLEYAFY